MTTFNLVSSLQRWAQLAAWAVNELGPTKRASSLCQASRQWAWASSQWAAPSRTRRLMTTFIRWSLEPRWSSSFGQQPMSCSQQNQKVDDDLYLLSSGAKVKEQLGLAANELLPAVPECWWRPLSGGLRSWGKQRGYHCFCLQKKSRSPKRRN